MRARIKRRERIRRLTILVVAVVIVVSLVVGLYFALIPAPSEKFVGKPVSASVLNALTGVSDTTLTSIGVPSGVTLPSSISGSPLTLNGKPEVLYIGGNYCPFCAVERWSIIIALSRFGQFSNLAYMLSSPSDQNPNSPTFTFENASYSSNYISFVPVEEFGNDPSTVIQPLTTAQQSIVSQYDTCPSSPSSSGAIPFMDIDNAYAINCGAQSALDIHGENWTQISSQLNDPSSNVAMLIDGAANTIITAICKVDGGSPASVCDEPFANQTIAYVHPGSSGSDTFIMAAPALRPGPAWSR
jgi:hypothetical protein